MQARLLGLDLLDSSEDDYDPEVRRLPKIDGVRQEPINYLETDKLFAEQTIREITIIYENGSQIRPKCERTPYIENMNMNNIRTMIETQPYNADLFKLLFCTVQAGLILHPNEKPYSTQKGEQTEQDYLDDEDILPNSEAIKNTLSDLTIIGSGVYGSVYAMKVNQTENIFTIKTSKRDEQERDSIVHEFFVGLILNKLRRSEDGVPQTPNLLYVYGVFKCFNLTGPKNTPFLCPINGQVRKYFMITEYVRGSQFSGYFRDITIEDLLSIYCQLLFTLHTAWIAHDFTHYDLHPGNIVVEKLHQFSLDKNQKSQLIPYFINGEMIYVKANLLPKIVDYGMSHIANADPSFTSDDDDPTDFEHFGNMSSFVNGIPGINPLNSRPLYDLYRITGEIIHSLKEGKNDAAYAQFFPLFLRFPNVQDKQDEIINDFDYKGPADFAVQMENFLKAKHKEFWPYDSKNSDMEIGDVFLETIEFIKESYMTQIVFNEDEKNDLVAQVDPTNGQYEAGVFRCQNNCTNVETLKQAAGYPGSFKRRK